MRTPIDEQLLEETSRYALKYTCEACAHFNVVDGSCSLGYPNGGHRLVPLQLGKKLTFCKEFTLV
jgi:hypothetical protein